MNFSWEWIKGKGCDIGYALAASSCEGAYSVDACTVTALDAITAFAIPNPGSPSQSQPVFSGLVALQVALLSGSLSLLRTDKFYFVKSFQPSTWNKLNSCLNGVNAISGVKMKYLCTELWKTQNFRVFWSYWGSKRGAGGASLLGRILGTFALGMLAGRYHYWPITFPGVRRLHIEISDAHGHRCEPVRQLSLTADWPPVI